MIKMDTCDRVLYGERTRPRVPRFGASPNALFQSTNVFGEGAEKAREARALPRVLQKNSYVGGNVLAYRGLRSFAVVARLPGTPCRPARHHFRRYRHGANGLARDLRRFTLSLRSSWLGHFRNRTWVHHSWRCDFSLTGKRASKIPQEAIIGIAYVVAAAAAVLLLSRAAEGDEEIKQMLVGNILLVTPAEVWRCFTLFVVVGIFHFLLRQNFFLVSFDRDRAYQQGLRVRWWDFSFYASFGLVVTIFVRMAGVLLVFQLPDRSGGLRY